MPLRPPTDYSELRAVVHASMPRALYEACLRWRDGSERAARRLSVLLPDAASRARFVWFCVGDESAEAIESARLTMEQLDMRPPVDPIALTFHDAGFRGSVYEALPDLPLLRCVRFEWQRARSRGRYRTGDPYYEQPTLTTEYAVWQRAESAAQRALRRQKWWTAAEKTAAMRAVHAAIKDGTLTRPERCEDCRLQPGDPRPRSEYWQSLAAAGCVLDPPAVVLGEIQAHHHRGYSPENHLDIRWLCPACHGVANKTVPAPIREPSHA